MKILEDYSTLPLFWKMYFYPLYVKWKIINGESLKWHWVTVILAPAWVMFSPFLLLPLIKQNAFEEKGE